ncbi:MAG TPA: efflux RND transporter periplasmic adaptor subunit [Bacillota bacterium]
MTNITPQTSNENQNPVKRVTGKALIFFFSGMILLTFFSRTINNYMIPRVKVDKPSSGALVKEVTGSGTVEACQTFKVYSNNSNAMVNYLNVRVGDQVRQGQILLVLDAKELSSKLHEYLNFYKAGKITFNQLLNQVSQYNLTVEKQKLRLAEIKLKEAQNSLRALEVLCNEGAEPEIKYRRAELDLLEAEEEYKLHQETMKLKFLQNRELLKQSIFIAPFSGIITEVNVEQGGFATGTKYLIQLTNTANGFVFKATVPSAEANYLSVGDSVQVSLQSMTEKTIKGVLISITGKTVTNNEDQKELTIKLPQELKLTGGEHGNIVINKMSGFYSFLVPLSALCEDDEGTFVWTVKERQGPLGNEYYVVKTFVTVGDKDNYKAGIYSGIEPGSRIVIETTKKLEDESRVIIDASE